MGEPITIPPSGDIKREILSRETELRALKRLLRLVIRAEQAPLPIRLSSRVREEATRGE